MKKRILSYLMAAALVCVNLPEIALANSSTYADWVVPERYTNKMTDTFLQNNMAGSKQTASGAYSTGNTECVYSISSAVSQEEKRLYAGMMLNTNGEFFTFEAGKTYVFSMDVKNASSEGIVPSIGIGMCDASSSMVKAYSNEYGTTGMALTDSTNWMDFDVSITLPGTYSNSVSYSKRIWHGFLNGTGGAGYAYALRTDSADNFYMAEEQAYDIKNTRTDNVETIGVGSELTFESEIINQIGIEGGLSQDVSWVVLDSNREPVSSGFDLVTSGNSVTATVTSSAQSGTYYVYAYSTAYTGMGKGVEITVDASAGGGSSDDNNTTNQYDDYVEGTITKAANLIPDASTEYGTTYFSMTSGNISGNCLPGTDYYTNEYTYTGSGTVGTDWRGVDGLNINRANSGNNNLGPFGFVAEGGANYVFSAKVKNTSENGATPVLSLAMNDTRDAANIVWAREYATAGMSVTDSTNWMPFNATWTLPSTYAASSTGYEHYLFFGFTAGNTNGAKFKLDVSEKDSVYFAKEQAYNIAVNCKTAADDIRIGNSVECEATVLNQLGTQYNGANSFEWLLLDNTKTPVSGVDVVDGCFTIPSTLSPGVYYVFAKSTADTRLKKSVQIEVLQKIVEDKEIGAASAPENMIGDATDQTNFGSESDSAVVDVQYENNGGNVVISLDAIQNVGETAGLQVSDNAAGLGTNTFVAGDDYVISMDAWSEDAANLNIKISDGTNEVSAEAVTLGSSSQTAAFAVTIPSGFDVANATLVIGLDEGSIAGSNIKISADSIYIAPEKAMSANVVSNGGSVVYFGSDGYGVVAENSSSKYVLTASVLNQAGEKGKLSQEFLWNAYASDKSTETDKINLTEVTSGNSSSVMIGISDYAEPGTYYVSCEPKNYQGILKVYEITVNKPTANEIAASFLNTASASEIESTLSDKLQKASVDETIRNNVNISNLSSLIVSNRAVSPLGGATLKEDLEKLAVISLYMNNSNSLSLYDANGFFNYADKLNLSGLFAGSTLNEVFNNTTDEGRKQVQTELTGGTYTSAADFDKAVALNIILKAIANPVAGSGSTYIGSILTAANAQKADLTITNYLNLTDKSSANATLAGKTYSKSQLETVISGMAVYNPGTITPVGGVTGNTGSTHVATSVTGNTKYMKFTDVSEEHWAYDYIYHLNKLGVASGIDEYTYSPEGIVTREQYVKLIIEALKFEKTEADLTFNDCNNNSWYSTYIATAVQKGLIMGINENDFGLGKPITRQDMCVILGRIFNDNQEDEIQSAFSDFEEISDYAKASVQTMYDYGIINGYNDGTFGPKKYCTRAEAAKMICIVMNLRGLIE